MIHLISLVKVLTDASFLEIDILKERKRIIFCWNKVLYSSLIISMILFGLATVHVIYMNKIQEKFKTFCPFYMKQVDLEMKLQESVHSTCRIQIVMLAAVANLRIIVSFLILICTGLFETISYQLFFEDKNHVNVAGLFVSTYFVDIRHSWKFKLLLFFYNYYFPIFGIQAITSACMVVMNLNFWPGLVSFCQLIPGNYTIIKYLTTDAYLPYESLLEPTLILEITSCEDNLIYISAGSLVLVFAITMLQTIFMINHIKLKFETDLFFQHFSKLIYGFDNKATSLQNKYFLQALEDIDFIEKCKNLHKFNVDHPISPGYKN